ncbi:hypothetical protein H4Q32_024335 [Labeo rohita]|uniref:ribonuclease H n=1 Tax=Labeo rohita TaxID=84645 RepID=A0ABQ8LYL7_LABRO|nr:hypothetical protein H4Q32_024335 [Labeo rohita]
MLTLTHILTCVRDQDRFVAIDLKDAHFHVSMLPRHRPFLRFALEGRAYQYKVLHFDLSQSPRVFTKVVEAALAPLREVGIRILNYFDDWLILAHSRDIVCTHRDVVLNHLARLGLQVNWEKSKLSPAQSILPKTVHSREHADATFIEGNCQACEDMPLSTLRSRAAFFVKIPEGGRTWFSTTWLVWDFRSTGKRANSPQRRVSFPRPCTVSAEVCESTQTQNSGPPETLPEAPGAHGMLSRGHATGPDAHETAAALASYPSPEMGMAPRHIQCPWEDISFLQFGVPLEQVSRRIVVTTDDSKTGWGAVCNGHAASGIRTGPRLLWHINCLELLIVLLALKMFRSLVQGKHVLVRTDNTATVAYINHQGGVRSFRMSQLARHLLLWSQHRFKSLRATHIPGEFNRVADALIHSLPVVVRSNQGTQLAEGPSQVCVSPSEPHCTDPVQGQGGQRTGSSDSPILAQQNLVLGPCAPLISPSLAHSSEEGPPFSGEGHNLAPAPRSLEPPPMVPGREQEEFRDLPPSEGKDPWRCGIESVLSFLQGGLDRYLSASTLKVHVAAFSANHDLVEGRSDLAVVLQALQQDPFEPLQSVNVNALSMKTALLTALTSVKRAGDLQALSVNSSCLEFGPADSHVVLRPRPGYVSKVPTTPFRDQVVTLQAIPSQEGQQKGKAVSKQRISHWLVDAIRLAYQTRGLPCPLGVRAHLTRGVAASTALANGTSLTDICRAAGWRHRTLHLLLSRWTKTLNVDYPFPRRLEAQNVVVSVAASKSGDLDLTLQFEEVHHQLIDGKVRVLLSMRCKQLPLSTGGDAWKYTFNSTFLVKETSKQTKPDCHLLLSEGQISVGMVLISIEMNMMADNEYMALDASRKNFRGREDKEKKNERDTEKGRISDVTATKPRDAIGSLNCQSNRINPPASLVNEVRRAV